jgi:hypothetical protein
MFISKKNYPWICVAIGVAGVILQTNAKAKRERTVAFLKGAHKMIEDTVDTVNIDEDHKKELRDNVEVAKESLNDTVEAIDRKYMVKSMIAHGMMGAGFGGLMLIYNREGFMIHQICEFGHNLINRQQHELIDGLKEEFPSITDGEEAFSNAAMRRSVDMFWDYLGNPMVDKGLLFRDEDSYYNNNEALGKAGYDLMKSILLEAKEEVKFAEV